MEATDDTTKTLQDMLAQVQEESKDEPAQMSQSQKKKLKLKQKKE
jgi:hypothetical protein